MINGHSNSPAISTTLTDATPRLCGNAVRWYPCDGIGGMEWAVSLKAAIGSQKRLLPDSVDDYVREDSPVRVIDVFVDELDLLKLGFAGSASAGRPGYHPAMLLKLYLYGYLNQVQSSRWLEQVDASIERYLSKLDTADRQEDEVAEMRVTRLTERIEALRL